jgi:tetratricopeptide (TPR) repeat protein
MPAFMRIDILLELAGFCVERGDKTVAMVYVVEAQKLLEEHAWPWEYYFQIAGKVFEARARAGDGDTTSRLVDEALALYRENESSIESFRRGRAVRPLAQALAAAGDRASALKVYAQAVEVGAVNINARTRAEDLSTTLLSMALMELEPDAAIWERVRQIQKGLADPW